MTATTTLTGFIVRETEKAVGFIAARGEDRPLYIPRKKIASLIETDEMGITATIHGERVLRNGIPVQVEVDAEWLERVGA